MAVYVDPLLDHGWKLYGKRVKSCHMLADDLNELHNMAKAIGLKSSYFQPKSTPHYDLVESKRNAALELGAIPISLKDAILKCRELRRNLH